jgi:cellulose synthase/poly-beta-1,6-N-acetylglucosamine synthase-like glycosyltransferase
MNTPLWIAVFIFLAVALFSPTVWLIGFCKHYACRVQKPFARPAKWPPVAVLLPLRGPDPMLLACLQGIQSQDYPDYEVFIVVDSETDPAMDTLDGFLARQNLRIPVHVDVLRNPGEHCSLKMSAHLQALTQLDDRFENVVFLDADSVTRPDWLRSMIAPFFDSRVGATTGVPWYTPRDRSFGTLVRHLFNMGTLATMHMAQIPWGGSQAMPLSLVRGSNLISLWSRCFGEDTSVCRVLRARDLRLEFIPQATNFNHESSALASCFRFIQRQAITTRLHADLWPLILFSGLAYCMSILLCYGILGVGVISQAWEVAAGAATLLLAHGLVFYTLLKVLESLVRRRHNPPPATRFGWKLVPASVIMHAMIAYAMVRAMTIRTFEWRGIRYRVDGRDRLSMLGYSPYGENRPHGREMDSIV